MEQEFEASAAGLCASFAARYGPSSELRPVFDSLLDSIREYPYCGQM
jgi:hypothetical protein